MVRKGGRRDPLAINPQTAARLRAYLELWKAYAAWWPSRQAEPSTV
jgi:hypothetical protein